MSQLHLHSEHECRAHILTFRVNVNHALVVLNDLLADG